MKEIQNILYNDNSIYETYGTSKESTSNNFDAIFQEETIVYATPQSDVSATTSDNSSNDTVPAQLESIFQKAASTYHVDIQLLKAIAKQESNFNSQATSAAGAMGVMQLMPETAKHLGVNDPYDAEQNIMGGAKYIAQMLQKYNYDIPLALAAYNAGPGNVDKYNGIPPFQETRQYVKNVMHYYGQNIQIPNTGNSQEAYDALVYAVPDHSLSTSLPDVTTIYAVAAQDVTSPTKMKL